MKRAVLFVLLLSACGAAGDGDERADGPRARGSARVGGNVVATVDGHPIDVETVMSAARAAGVPPELALARLEDEALLAAAAERAGFADDPAVRRATERAAVQALLARTVEAEVTEEAIDPATLEEALEASPERFDRPERRRSAHVLAAVPEGAPAEVESAAEAWIRRLHAEAAASRDPAAHLAGVRPDPSLPFEVSYEDVPPLARTDEAAAGYVEALFGAEVPGLLPPVRTGLGWHVIVVTEIVPAWRPTREEALAVLRSERLAALRAARLEELVRELAARTEVRLERDVIRRAFADPQLSGGGE